MRISYSMMTICSERFILPWAADAEAQSEGVRSAGGRCPVCKLTDGAAHRDNNCEEKNYIWIKIQILITLKKSSI